MMHDDAGGAMRGSLEVQKHFGRCPVNRHNVAVLGKPGGQQQGADAGRAQPGLALSVQPYAVCPHAHSLHTAQQPISKLARSALGQQAILCNAPLCLRSETQRVADGSLKLIGVRGLGAACGCFGRTAAHTRPCRWQSMMPCMMPMARCCPPVYQVIASGPDILGLSSVCRHCRRQERDRHSA